MGIFWAYSGIFDGYFRQVFGAWLTMALLLLYCKVSGAHRKCWGGWSAESCRNLGLLAKLAAAGMTQIMGQWW